MNRNDLYTHFGEADISIKDEISELFKKYSRWGLLRRMRRNANGKLLPCPQCRKIGTQGHAVMHICDKCLGVGYIWDEEWVRYYQWPGVSASTSKGSFKQYMEWGALPTNFAIIYLEAGKKPTEEDKVIEVEHDDTGTPIQPTVRKMLFDIRSIDDYRLDGGRLEYFRLAAMKQTLGRFGQPLSTAEPGPRRTP